MIEDRAYQADVIAEFDRTVATGKRRILLVAPTGSGKTVIASMIIRAFREGYRKVLVISHRREIIKQTSDKLHAAGIMHGIIQAGVSPRPLEPVQIASVQTLWVRAVRTDKMAMPPADLLIIDECHRSRARTYQRIIEAYPDAIVLGLTATPCRGDGRGLGAIYETMIECPQVAALIDLGFLVKTRCYAPTTPDLAGVRVQAGDWVECQLADRMDRPKLIGDIVTHWHKFGERRRTVVFCVNVAHSVHVRDEFIRSGVRAEHVDGGTPKAERDAALARLASGEIEVVCNCMVLTEGWDLPQIGCVILARPTRQMGLYRQMIGRGLRTADGKPDCIIIDHSGAVYRHGLAEDPVTWTLDPDRLARSEAHDKRCLEPKSRLLECAQCSSIRTAGEPCPHCGFLPQAPPRAVPIIMGNLGLVENGRAQPSEYNRHEWHAMLAHIAVERGYKPGWAAYKFKEKFGHWPQMRSIAPIEPSREVLSWVRSRQIAYAKSRQAAEGAA